jgi:hypothetical protein
MTASQKGNLGGVNAFHVTVSALDVAVHMACCGLVCGCRLHSRQSAATIQESELSTVQSCSYPCPRRINRSALLRADFYCGELFLFGPTRHTLSVVLHLCTP